MTDFDRFRAVAASVLPRAAVVLGSGLAGAAAAFAPAAEIGYAHVPGLVPPSVHGHSGRLAVGTWAGTPAIVCFGRVHFYEGHARERVTTLVRLAASLGVRAMILTNAAGGIHPALEPGELMAIRGHLKLLDPTAWKRAVVESPYSPRLLAQLQHLSAARPLQVGVYAALTGPSYETPAEIRAMQTIGADAVGMSTAVEAEAAAELGLEVAGLSCITNRAAGLSAGPLSHAEVETTAKLAVGRIAELMSGLLKSV